MFGFGAKSSDPRVWIGLVDANEAKYNSVVTISLRGMEQLLSSKDVLLRMINAFATGEITDVDDFVAEEYFDHQGLGSGPMHGGASFRTVVAAARSSYVELRVTALDVVEESEKSVARIEWVGELRDGKTRRRETIDIIRVRDGKAIEHWGALSTDKVIGASGEKSG